jgi:hypothetical protein
MEVVPELLSLQPHISRNVMEYLMGKCINILHLRVVRQDGENFRVYNGREDYLVVSRPEGQEIWLCECEESLKTKLPCAHELCVCIRFSLPIEPQIGKRWTNEE